MGELILSEVDYKKIFKDIDDYYRNDPKLLKDKIDIGTWRSFAWNCVKGEIQIGIKPSELDVLAILKGTFDSDKILKLRKLQKPKEVVSELKQAAKSFQSDYVDLAEHFWEKQPFYYDSVKIWWLWNFNMCCWKRIDETDILNSIYNSSKEQNLRITSASIKSEITTSMKMVGRLHKPLESPKNIIQFKDKIYWINEDKIKAASPEYFNCNPIPFEVGKTDKTPIMEKTFTEWVGKDYVQTLYEIIAYCMIQDYPINRIFFFVGSGSNGKSCFLNLLNKTIGEKNCSSTELDRLTKTFGTACLYKKLVCLIGETNSALLEKTSVIKRVSGNDPIDFEFKGKDTFSGKSYSKLIIATNNVPPSIDKTDGWYRRCLSIKFPNKFSEKKDILADIPEIEYNNLCKKSLNILKELIIKREFTNEGSVEDRKKRYEELSNPLTPFIKENCIIDINEQIPIYEFFDYYCVYLKQRGHREPSKQEVTKTIIEEGFTKQLQNIKTTNGEYKKYWCYIGLRLKDINTLKDISTNSTNSITNTTSTLYKRPNTNHSTNCTICTKPNPNEEFDEFIKQKVPEEYIKE